MINPIVSFVMPIGNLLRDRVNIEENISGFIRIDNCELILIVDSADPQALREFEESITKIENLRVLSGVFANPGGPRNLGIKEALGSWIAFIDSDDKTDFKKFLQVILEAQELGTELVVGSFSVEKEGSIRTHILNQEASKKKIESIARSPGIWRMGFRRTVVGGVKFPEIKMGEDQVFLARLNFWKLKVHFSPELVYCYRSGTSGQLTMNKKAISDLVKAQEETLKVLLSKKNIYGDSKIIAIMLSKQFLTAIRRLGIRGFLMTFRTLLKSTEDFNSFKMPLLLLQTCSSEIWIKARGLASAKGRNE